MANHHKQELSPKALLLGLLALVAAAGLLLLLLLSGRPVSYTHLARAAPTLTPGVRAMPKSCASARAS